jgi:hypothetical protein
LTGVALRSCAAPVTKLDDVAGVAAEVLLGKGVAVLVRNVLDSAAPGHGSRSWSREQHVQASRFSSNQVSSHNEPFGRGARYGGTSTGAMEPRVVCAMIDAERPVGGHSAAPPSQTPDRDDACCPYPPCRLGLGPGWRSSGVDQPLRTNVRTPHAGRGVLLTPTGAALAATIQQATSQKKQDLEKFINDAAPHFNKFK